MLRDLRRMLVVAKMSKLSGRDINDAYLKKIKDMIRFVRSGGIVDDAQRAKFAEIVKVINGDVNSNEVADVDEFQSFEYNSEVKDGE